MINNLSKNHTEKKIKTLFTPPHIHLIAPGGKCEETDIPAAKELLSLWGLSFSSPTNLLDAHPLYASPDNLRLKHLKDALLKQDKNNVLWALRGGSGTSRILNALYKTQAEKPTIEKTIIGFSDITALLIYVNQLWGWKPIHGPTLNSLTKDNLTPKAFQKIKDLVTIGKTSVSCLLQSITNKMNADIKAPLVGGNLSLIQRSISTPWQLNATNKIVFFEDIHEPPYRIAELLDHLLHAGILDGAKAVILGDFSQNNIASKASKSTTKVYVNDDLLPTVIKEFSRHFQKPVFTGLPSGHFKNNHPFQIGQECSIQTEGNKHTFHQDLILP